MDYNIEAIGIGNVRVVIKKGANSLAEIVQQKGYYAFGMEISQFSAGTGTSKNWYNGKEIQDDFGLYWYDYGARFYDPMLGRWHSIDPLADERTWVSPYNFVQNNPILRVDPSGMLDWIPEVDKNNNVNYIAESGDNATTLQKQFGLKEGQAEKIIGNGTINTGDRVSGKSVKEVTGNEILKLDYKNSTIQQRIDQVSFALQNNTTNPNGFYVKEYFNNYKSSTGFGVATKEKGFIRTSSGNVPVTMLLTYNGGDHPILAGANTIYNKSNNQFNAEYMYLPKLSLPGLGISFQGKNNYLKLKDKIGLNWDGMSKEEKTDNPFR